MLGDGLLLQKKIHLCAQKAALKQPSQTEMYRLSVIKSYFALKKDKGVCELLAFPKVLESCGSLSGESDLSSEGCGLIWLVLVASCGESAKLQLNEYHYTVCPSVGKMYCIATSRYKHTQHLLKVNIH